jgi:hypothetical protein
MRAATNFLVANYGRQKIIAMPCAVPKVAIFEEAARTLEIPGGVRMIQEYKYTYLLIHSEKPFVNFSVRE